MKNKLLKLFALVFALTYCVTAFGQLESDEQPSTNVALGSVNYAHYDNCNGVLELAIPTTQDAAGEYPIKEAYIYVKIGTQWKNMLTIRGEDSRCCNNTCGTGMSNSIDANTGTQTPAANTIVDATHHNNGCGGGGTNNTMGNLNHPKYRVAWYSGANSNFAWFSWEDEGLCEHYDNNLNLVDHKINFVPISNPPRIDMSHSSHIQNHITSISVYPTNDNIWALDIGITNVPMAAIIGNSIQVRVYCAYQNNGANGGHDFKYENYEYSVGVQAPDAPSGLSASTDQCGKIDLSWSNSSQTWSGQDGCSNAEVYNNVIYRDGVKIAVVSGDATSYTDNVGLTPRQTYKYTVRTILWNENHLNFRESSISNVATGNMKMPPAQPSPFTASNDNCDTTIALSWSQPNGTAVNTYSLITPAFSSTSVIANSARSYNWVTNVTRGTTYNIKLVARNDCGYPSDTASTTGISPADPALPTNVKVSLNAAKDTATVTWKDNANNESKYQVVRQDNEGNVVTFDRNPNDTIFVDGGIVSCRDYTYSVAVFNQCDQSGLISATSDTTGVIPPPNLNTTFTSTKKLTCSKGYFSNRVELSWQNNNGQNIDLFKIYRKIQGSTADSTLIGTSAAGSGFYVDNTCDARVYYKYTIVGVKYCNGNDILSNTSEDIGFRNPTGLVSGHIEYNGGIALKGAKVIIQQSGSSVGSSLKFTPGGTLTMEHPSSLNLSNDLRVGFWLKRTSTANQNFVNKDSVFSFTESGSKCNAVAYINKTKETISVDTSNFPMNNWKHVAMQYISARGVFKLYADGMPIDSITNLSGSIGTKSDTVKMGGPNASFNMDEFRVLAKTESDTDLYTDHMRFINASDAGFRIMLHCDEGYGDHAYDVSSQNSVYNANHFVMSATNVNWSSDIPTSGQLSYFGITDSLGNYTVNGIVYSGTGENFTIIPSFLTHSFTPSSRSVFIGDAATVFSNQDFTDNSSFTVSGHLYYVYNGDTLSNIGVPDAQLKIDGSAVIANGQQVTTDASGAFTIQVPIGQHYITVERYKHFLQAGRFPVSGTYNFQSDLAGMLFLDSTKRSIVGRVVGGLVEANKVPGMGRSKNNIGQAMIKLSSPIAGNAKLTVTATTVDTSGEYRFSVPPLDYKIDSVYVINASHLIYGGVDMSGTPSLTNSTQTLDLRNITDSTHVVDTLFDSNGGVVSVDSTDYFLRHDFVYRVKPTISVLDTDGTTFIGDDSININGTMTCITPTCASNQWGSFGWPVFTQGNTYHAEILADEIYKNYDNNNLDTVLLSGNVNITNDLVDGTDTMSHLTLDSGRTVYTFTCGAPNTSSNSVEADLSFTKDIQVNVIPTGAATVSWQPNTNGAASDPYYHAYVVGKRITGTGVATQGPEKVDYILRDPPGSGSSATWTAGSSTTNTESFSYDASNSDETSAELTVGTKEQVGLGVAEDIDVEDNTSLGLNTTISAGAGGSLTETTTSSYSVSTRDDPDNVGADADVFIGRSRNWFVGPTLNIELQSTAKCAITGACFGPTVNGQRLAKMSGYAIAPGATKTRFSYTQSEIEGVVIPTLEDLRKTYLTTNSHYHSNLPVSDPNFGINNDDPAWGAQATTTTPFVYEPADTTGPSYTFYGYNNGGQDTVRVLNTQISLWKQALAQNEKEKMECKNNMLYNPQPGQTVPYLLDNFTLGSAIVSNSYTTDQEDEVDTHFELSLTETDKQAIKAELGGNGASVEESLALTETTGGSASVNSGSTTEFDYTLTDGDPGDIQSIDVYKTGTGDVFISRGGQTMCPYEGGVVCHYFNPAKPNAPITASTYNANGFASISPATVQREVPHISITPSAQYGIPSDQAATYQLTLTNQSALTVNNDISMRVYIASQSNPNGAIIKIDGLSPNTSYTIPTGASVIKTLTVERGPIAINYDSIMVVFASECSDAIADTAYISAHFIPTCTDLSMTAPSNNWVFNNSVKDTGNLVVSNYNYNYGAAMDTSLNKMLGLNNITLEFKPSNTSAWTTFHTFYKYPDSTGLSPLPDSLLASQVYAQYLWDLSTLPDGDYEIKATSQCLNHDGSYSTVDSPVLSGVIDRINPHPFGTPSPATGILNPSDDISIQFNEPLDIGSMSNANFDVRGVLNGGTVRHATSLYFNGTSAYAEVPGGASLQKRDFTFEFWCRRDSTGYGTPQTVISQGTDPLQSMKVGFDGSNKLTFSLGNSMVSSNGPEGTDGQWHHYAIAYNYSNQVASLYVDGVMVNSGNTSIPYDYNGSGKVDFGRALPAGNNYFKGNLQDVRLWNSERTQGDIVQNFNKVMSINESGLLYNWRMNEATGLVAADDIRSRNADIHGASWEVDPNGSAVKFNGSSYIDITSSTIPITKDMDFTLEFWFNSTQSSAATLFSNGKGDGLGADSLLSWNIEKDASGKIHVYHDGMDFVAVDSNFFDGNWHHFALVLDRNANLSAYIDGNLQNSVQAISFHEMGGAKMFLGARGYYTGSVENHDLFYQGKMDEFRFWDLARTVQQIKRDKQNRMEGNEYGLVAYVPFENYVNNMGVPTLTPSIKNYATSTDTNVVVTSYGATLTSQTPTLKLPRPVQAVAFTWSLNNDKIIITPTTAPNLLENVTLDITVKGVYDMHGNIMQSPKTWIAYYNKNQVKWQDPGFNFTKTVDSVITFTEPIVNSGGAQKAFTIGGLPNWMTASMTSGTIAPNSTENVQFTIPAGQSIGDHKADITLTTDFNYSEVLRIDDSVKGTPPVWNVNPANFQYSMNVFGQLKIDGVIATDNQTKIAAFNSNGQICGVANLQYLPTYDRYEVFLNIYSNQITGDSIHFNIYDASTGLTFVNVTPTMMFVENNVVGTVTNPVTFVANTQVAQPIPLNAGWTWVSFPLQSTAMHNSNALLHNIVATTGDVSLSQTAYDQYDSTLGWIGNISQGGGYLNSQSYKIKSAVADTLVQVGSRINPDSAIATINVQAGWNWIGYVSTKHVSLSEALGNYNASNGDIIKSQYQFAYYDSLNGWTGSLTYMNPGQGYMLKAANASTFNYPLSSFYGRYSAPGQETVANAGPQQVYAFAPATFKNTMSAVVRGNICSDVLDNGKTALGAFDQSGQLRGYAYPIKVNNDYNYYLTLYSNSNGENLQLKYFNTVDGTVLPTNTTVSFATNTLDGTPLAPVIADVADSLACTDATTGIAQVNSNKEVNVYPNPFTHNLTIVFGKPVSCKIELIDVLGRVVYSTEISNKEDYTLKLDSQNTADIKSGIYLLHITGDINKEIKVVRTK